MVLSEDTPGMALSPAHATGVSVSAIQLRPGFHLIFQPSNPDNYYTQKKRFLNTLGHTLPRVGRRATLGETTPASVFTGEDPCESNCSRPCSPWRRSLASP
jgi:hypothetical protein